MPRVGQVRRRPDGWDGNAFGYAFLILCLMEQKIEKIFGSDMKKIYSTMIVTGIWMFVLQVAWAGGRPGLREEEIAKKIGFDEKVLLIAKEASSDGHVRRLIGYNEDGYQVLADGLCVSVHLDKSGEILHTLRQKLRPFKYMAYIVEENDVIKAAKIGILKGTDPYLILRVMQTSGTEYDISTEDIISRLMEWEKCSSFEVIGAGNNWLELAFSRMPRDMKSFVKDVQDFCPDAVDDGAMGLVDLERNLLKTKRLFLSWE